LPQFEFREHTRTTLEVQVAVWVAGQDEIVARIGDISAGGCFVALVDPPPVGTSVRLKIELKGDPVEAFAEVVWIRLTSKTLDQPAGMGLQFRFFLGDGLTRLKSALI